MAATKHSRRGALGILATSPVSLLPALAVMQCSQPVEAGASAAWMTATASYERARRERNRFNDEQFGPADLAHDRGQISFADYSRVEEELTRLDLATMAALDAVCAIVSPDLVAFRQKLAWLKAEYGTALRSSDLEWMETDLAHLIGRGVH